MLFLNYYLARFSPKAKDIKSERDSSKDKDMKISAINDGYLPFFHPEITKKHANNNNTYPIGSLPMAKTYLCNEGYGLVKYKSDRFGLRNSDHKWSSLKNRTNIFFLEIHLYMALVFPTTLLFQVI